MARVLSGIQPSGDLHIGNLVGAIARWAADQRPEHTYCIVDLHAMSTPYDPADLRERTLGLATWLYAAGLDADVVTLFVQSQVREHAELAWVLGSVATFGELRRMTQFKDKGEGRESVSVDLFTYPVLQAADILLHQAEEVPVGEDQRQHIELTRDIAQRFNHRYGDTFTLPQATLPAVGARVMDLQAPDRKMSKSLPPPGTLLLADDEAATRKKVMRARTDSAPEVRAGQVSEEVANLLDLFAAVTGSTRGDLEGAYDGKGYGTLKKDLAEAVNGYLRPVRLRHAELAADPGAVREALRKGADRARGVAADTMTRVRERVGLLP